MPQWLGYKFRYLILYKIFTKSIMQLLPTLLVLFFFSAIGTAIGTASLVHPAIPIPIPGTALKTVCFNESFVNGLSQVQTSVEGNTPGVYHPTGSYIEAVFNPAGICGTTYSAFPPYTNTIAQNMGFCTSMLQDDCGIWKCELDLLVYKSPAGVCIPPNAACQNFANGEVLGSLKYGGIFPACSAVPVDFQLAFYGGTGIYAGARGVVNATQAANYQTFQYKFIFE